jgi:hypothetical protein
MKTIMILFIFSKLASAQYKTNLFTNKDVISKAPKTALLKGSRSTLPSSNADAGKPPRSNDSARGNLPSFYLNRSNVTIDESPIITPTTRQTIKNADLKSGEVIHAEIKESLFAFNESKSPIRAII